MHFSFIYFDVGGVVIRDFSGTNKWEEMHRDMGITPQNQKSFNTVWSRFEDQVNLDIDVDDLLPIISTEVGIQFPQKYSLLADFVSRFNQNRVIWEVIRKLHQNRKVGLLTNMYPRMLNAIIQTDLMPPESWDAIVDSSVVGFQKPDEAIFRIAQEKAGVPNEEIFFVDNVLKNVEAARELGWGAFHYDSSNPDQASEDLASIFFE